VVKRKYVQFCDFSVYGRASDFNAHYLQAATKGLLSLLKKFKNRHLWIGHIIRHNEFVLNILEGAISEKKAVGRSRPQYWKQVARNTS
jgi:hypothetical protein